MSKKINFTNKQNIKILWDVLLDELNMKNDNTNLVNNIRSVFESNITPFVARMNHNSSLMDLNKLFLSQVVIAVNSLFPNLKHQQKMQKINISDEVLAPYKAEDIQTAKQTEFEKQVSQKQQEFDNFSSFKKPKELDFTLANTDSKITEMQLLIAETMAKRYFEVEQFEISNNSNLSSESETWLQSSNTSVKTDKQNALNETTKNVEQRKLKYNTFFKDERQSKDERQVHMLNKKVTFHEELEPNITLTIEENDTNVTNVINVINEPSHNILNKLKKVNPILTESSLDKLSAQMEELNSKFDILLELLVKKLV